MRVIAGLAKGRRLAVPKSGVRPTAGRVKEAMFSMLGFHLNGLTVLDAFAGSGSLGIEALSRGADHCSFVESDRNASRCVRRNLASTKLGQHADIASRDVLRFLSEYQRDPFDIIFMDPPYAYSQDKLLEILAAVVNSAVLGEHTRMMLEVDKRTTVSCMSGLAQIDERIYGDTKLVTFQKEGRQISG